MKKLKYIQPQTTDVCMQTIDMIAASNKIDSDSAELNPGTMGSGDGGDAASRRHRNDWEDEEFEENVW